MLLRRIFQPDRRRRPRQLLNTSVRVYTASGNLEAVGINVSDVGMCLFTAANLPIEAPIDVEFQTHAGASFERLRAIVRHRAFYLYGIEFLSSGPDSEPIPNHRPETTAPGIP